MDSCPKRGNGFELSSSSRVGSLPKSMSAFGKEVDVPKRSWDGEVPVVRDGVFLHPSRTNGRACVQLQSFVRMRNEVFNVR